MDYVQLLRDAIEECDRERIIPGARDNGDKFQRYCRGLELLKQLGKGKLVFEDPRIKYDQHMAEIQIDAECEITASEMATLREIISLFDSVILTCNTEQRIDVSFFMNNIYV